MAEGAASRGLAPGEVALDRAPPGSEGGLLLVDKPPGPSSFAIVRAQRRRFGVKAGHAGTLDPLASGLLLVLLGPATRLARYLLGLDKRYTTEIRLGARTSSGDAEGDIVEETALPKDLESALAGLTGEVELRVPAASAVKIGGERAYRLYRRGAKVEMPVRRTSVYELRVVRYEPPSVELALHVAAGTYVRAIADALGGHCRSLRRTAVGPFRVEDASPDQVLAPADALPFLPGFELDDDEIRGVLSGNAVERAGDGPARLLHGGRLIAVARLEDGLAKPETVLGLRS